MAERDRRIEELENAVVQLTRQLGGMEPVSSQNDGDNTARAVEDGAADAGKRRAEQVQADLIPADDGGEAAPADTTGAVDETALDAPHTLGGVRLTMEQRRIIDAVQRAATDGRHLRVVAYAGAGKTSTLRFASQYLSRPVYLAFNKAVAEDAKKSFPRHVTTKTVHALAFKAMNLSRSVTRQNLNSTFIKELIENHWQGKAPDHGERRLLANVIASYCQSAEDAIDESHVAQATGTPLDRVNPDAAKPVIQQAASIYDTILKNVEGWPHPVYLKQFERSPEQIRAAFQSFTVLLLDEAQDLNPVQRHIATQAGLPTVAIGDPRQQIYSWRGAEDALEYFGGDTLYLSQSFRFDPAIAGRAHAVLAAHPDGPPPVPLAGTPDLPRRGDGHAILCRSNVGVILSASDAYKAGRRVRIAASFEDIRERIHSAVALYEGNLGNVTHSAVRAFGTWDELKHASSVDPELRWLSREVEKGTLLKDLERAEKALAARAADADLTIATVHQAKGQEWPHVALRDDFPTLADLSVKWKEAVRLGNEAMKREIREEYHVLYVALTRTQDRLLLPDDLGNEITGADAGA